MAEIASAYVSLMPSAKGFGSKLDGEISGDVKASGKKAGSTFGKMFGLGAGLLAGAGLGRLFSDSIGEAREAQKVSAITESIIKSTGGVAKVTAGQVADLAGAISSKTGMDDEAIQAGANMLLTFKNVRNEVGKGSDVFNRATQAAADLSAAGFGDVNGQAKMLGKALNDPIKGMSALGRSGVTFTAQQQDQIKAMVASGDTLKAQKTILREVESQVGGAAAASATAGEKASVAFGNLKEDMGTALLPVIDKLSTAFTNDIAPAISGFITGLQTGEGAGGKFRDVVTDVVDAVQKGVGFLNDHKDALVGVTGAVLAGVAAYKAFMIVNAVMTAVKTGITLFKAWRAGTLAQTAAQMGLNTALLANPLGLVIAAIAALVVGFIIAYKKSDTFRRIVDKALSAVADAGKWMWNKVLKPAFDGMKKGFEAVGDAGIWLWNKALQPTFKFIIGGVAMVLDGYSAMLRGLSKVPGFGWAKKAADAMGAAADKARGVADSIKKIPSSKNVKVNVALSYSGLRSPTRGRDPLDASNILPRTAPPRELGRSFMDELGRGIAYSTPRVEKAAKYAFGKTAEAVKKARDAIRSQLQSLKGDFNSLRDSIKGAFTDGLFDATSGGSFLANLTTRKAELRNLLASFATLKGWGISGAFLSQLFASGNGALITSLAGMGKAGASQAATLFGQVNDLGTQLGTAVAKNDPIGQRIEETNRLLREANKALKRIGPDVGRELNGAAAKGHRDKKRRGK